MRRKPEPDLMNLLAPYRELHGKLWEAIISGRFMITIHCQKKVPGSNNDFQHYIFHSGYPTGDIVASLKHIATVHNAKINPNASTEGVKGWV